jgi:hypothetical protein
MTFRPDTKETIMQTEMNGTTTAAKPAVRDEAGEKLLRETSDRVATLHQTLVKRTTLKHRAIEAALTTGAVAAGVALGAVAAKYILGRSEGAAAATYRGR